MLYESAADLALTLNNSRRFQDVSVDSFQVLAAVSQRSFDEVSAWVRQMTERVLTVWNEKAAELPYLAEERARLDAHIGRIPLARGP